MPAARSQPIRILQIAGSLLGGVGVWLRAVLHHLDRQRFHLDFLVYHPYPHTLDDEVKALGAGVIRVPVPYQFPAFAYRLRRVLRDQGPYDIVHGHLHRLNGLLLRMARNAGVPTRIAHSHEVRSQGRSGLRRYLYEGLMNRWLDLYATGGLAASQAAAADLFGPDWQADRRWRVLYCGIDLAPFQGEVDPALVRGEFGIPPDAWVVGHVGSMWMGQKNHPFLVQVAAEVVRRDPGMRLLLVGGGPLRAAVERQVEESGLGGKVIFAGLRPDVPRLLRGAMQVFLFPSLHEGLGLGLVEAQAAGLPCVISDTIPREADVVPSLVQRLSLCSLCNVSSLA